MTKGVVTRKSSGLRHGVFLSILIALISPLFTVVMAPAIAIAPLPVCSPEMSTSGGYTIVKFIDSGECTWTTPADATELRGLIVGGGGGGGGNTHMGGGGGGGGYLAFETLTVTNQVLRINVGAGGAGGEPALNGAFAQNGETSSIIIGIDNSPSLKLVALGGGSGGSDLGNRNPGTESLAKSGGSGGGSGGGYYPAKNPGLSETVTAILPNSQTAASIGLSQLGNNGSLCDLSPYGGTGGGGGGAGTAGGCYIDSANSATVLAGHGGDGYPNNILGTQYWWAGGGGGGSFGYQTNIYWAGNGGLGGGGGGAAFGEQTSPQPRQGSGGAQGLSAASPGLGGEGGYGGANTGGGGGAGIHPFAAGGKGGSGIVVLKYVSSTWLAVARPSTGTTRLSAFTVQPQVAIQAGLNNETVTASSAVITATISSGGTLLGTATASASSGVATFSNLAANGTVGTRYTITYSSPGITSVTESVTLTPAGISLAAIGGVSAPASGATPVTAITATGEYTGTVTWAETLTAESKFAATSVYTATITLTAATGYSLSGLTANFFTVAGATSVSNSAGSGVITAVFPATGGAVTPTFSTWSNVSKTYGDASFTVDDPTVTGSVPGTFTYSSATTSVISVSGSTLTVEGAGSSVITATFTPTDSANYNIATTTMTVTVAKASRTLTIDSGSYESIYYIDPTQRSLRNNGDKWEIWPDLPTLTATASAGTGTLGYRATSLWCLTNRPRALPGSMMIDQRFSGDCRTVVRATITADSNYAMATSDPTPYIQVLRATYFYITYAKNGATGSLEKSSEIYREGKPGVTLPGVGGLTKEGYTFQGWSETGIAPVISGAYTPTGNLLNTGINVTLKAVWAPTSYHISYDADGGSSTPSSSTVEFGDTFVLADPITKDPSGGISYQFAGWRSGDTIYEAGETIRVENSDRTFTAVWVRQYEVTYLANGGDFASGDTEKDGECTSNICSANQGITLNNEPDRPGYTFAGWEIMGGGLVSDINNAVPGIQTTVTDSRYIFTASWLPIPYSVTYVSDGSAAPSQGSLNTGETFTVGSAVTKTGYTFDGWSNGTTKYWPDSEYQVGTSNISLTAQWINDLSPYDGANGTVSCSVAGNVTISANSATSAAGCEGAVVIPEGVISIESELFKDNSSITALTIPNSLVVIGLDAFASTTALTNYTYCGSELIDEAFTNAGLGTKTNICATGTNTSSAAIKSPPQESSIASIMQVCSSKSKTIIIKGTFSTPILNIGIDGRLINSSLWKQSAQQVEITLGEGVSGAISVELYNGQVPLLPAQTIVVSASCTDSEAGTPPKSGTEESLVATQIPKEIATTQILTKSLKFLDSVYFTTGSTKLTVATQKTLRAIAAKVKSSSTPQVLALGHADNRGNATANIALSKARSAAVIAFLKKTSSAPKYVVRWYGTSRPAGKGNSPAELAKDRRVEIWVR